MVLNNPNHVISTGAAKSQTKYVVSVLDVRNKSSNPNDSCWVAKADNEWLADDLSYKVCSIEVLGNEDTGKFLLLGEDGEVTVLGGGDNYIEKIKREINGPMTSLSIINGVAYALGMFRQVYFRNDQKEWIPMHGNILLPGELVGFNTLAFSEGIFYAAGWKGEIYSYKEGDWLKEESPSNMIISSATNYQDTEIALCGQNGVIIAGKTGGWRLIETESKESFWSSAVFNGVTYICSFHSIYKLKDDCLEEVDISVPNYNGTHYKLSVADGCLYSFGERDILRFDGTDWTRMDE